MMSKLRDLSLRTKLGAGGILAVLIALTAVSWYKVSPRPTGLPTAAELREPFTPPKSGPGSGNQKKPGPALVQQPGGLLSEEQGKALEAGKTVTINAPGGGAFVISPPKSSDSKKK
jgi:hypothetical protein